MDIRMSLAYIAAERGESNFQFGGSVTENTQEAWGSVVWEDLREKPTWAELEAVWPGADASFYAHKRMTEYPPIPDQIDAIKKGFDALRESGIALPDETTAWLDSVQAVKDKYPAPPILPGSKPYDRS